MPPPEAIERIESFRRRLLAFDAAAAQDLLTTYAPIFEHITAQIDLILAEVEGGQLTFGQVQRLERYRSLQAQIQRRVTDYAGDASIRITRAQREALGLVGRSTRQVVDAALPRGINLTLLQDAGLAWNALPAEALEALTGIAGNGAPLGELLQPLGAEVSAGVAETLKEGIAVGRSPRVIASKIRDRAGMGLTRALRISRTEMLRAFREGTRATYQQNPVTVRGYRRVAAKDADTCMACIALDGKRYAVGQPLDEHVNGRCALVPITPTYRELGIPVDEAPFRVESGQDWFMGQSAGTQRGMMGPGKYDAWRSGKVSLDDMATTHRDRVWGDQAVETPLKDLLAA